MAKNIDADATKVGNALTSVRLDEMLINLAKGIAWGQYELDKVGMDVSKVMGVPGVVTIGNERLSMLEAGFLPSFYQFVDAILELRMEVQVREEEVQHFRAKETSFRSYESESGGEVTTRAKAQFFALSYERSMKSSWQNRTKTAYSRTVDARHTQKYSQQLNAASMMRAKLVPKPPPELLIERIRILLDQLRKEAEQEARDQDLGNTGTGADLEERIMTILMDKLEQRLLGRHDAIVEKSPASPGA